MKDIYESIMLAIEHESRHHLARIRKHNREALAEVQAENGNGIAAEVSLEFSGSAYDNGYGAYMALHTIVIYLPYGMLTKQERADIESRLTKFQTDLFCSKHGASLWYAVFKAKQR